MRSMLLLCCALTAGSVSAQAVWRCGADGSQFQGQPCAEGQALAIRPAPPAAAVQEAREVAQRERLALNTLAAERHAREREALARGLGPAAIKPLAKEAPLLAPEQRRRHENGRPAAQRPRPKPHLRPWVMPLPAGRGT